MSQTKIQRYLDSQGNVTAVYVVSGYYTIRLNFTQQDVKMLVTGKDSKVRGALGCWLVLTERDDNYNIVDGKMVKVDGNQIKENMWYMLKNGKITEVEE